MAKHHLGFGTHSRYRTAGQTQGHLHHVNTQIKRVLNTPRTKASLFHIKTKNLAVNTVKLRTMCTFPPTDTIEFQIWGEPSCERPKNRVNFILF